MGLLALFEPRIGGGGVITAVGDGPDQAIYWQLVSVDPETGIEGAPWGSLRWPITKTDNAGLSVNIYVAPTDPGLTGQIDRVKAKRTIP